MAGAIRLVSLSRGHDPRDFALFAFGGAGPLHATALARELAIPTVLVPARPGITNALGCVVADVRHDYVRTVNKPLSALEDATISAIYAEQGKLGRATIEGEGVPVRELRFVYSADMQFQGQSHILSVPLEQPDPGVAGLHKAFAAAYWRRFGIELAEIPPVLVNLHTAVIGVRPHIDLGVLAATERAPTSEPRPVRRAARCGSATAGTDAGLRRDGCRSTPLRRPGDPRAARLHDRRRARRSRHPWTSSAIC
jgi:N-methylhydantoinase A